MSDSVLRDQLVQLLVGGQAHVIIPITEAVDRMSK